MKTKIIISAIVILTLAACKKESKDEATTGSTDRKKVLDDYNANYLGSALANSAWVGDISNCDAGTVPQSTHDKVIQRINYFRRLVGLNDNTTLDASLFAKYQETAMLMKANGQINHTPPNTWTCWTQLGADGAMTSNLSIGNHSVNAVTGQVRDDGSNNTAAGHRRWILHSEKTKFSYGTTDNTMSLGVMGVAGGNTKIPEFIAYPPKGFIPQTLVFTRWSFGIPNVNMDGANVAMTGPKGNVTLTVVSRVRGYGDNSVVWEPQGIDKTNADDVQYTVTISNVINGPRETYTYTVTIIKP